MLFHLFSLPQVSQHAIYSWCRLLPRFLTKSERSIALCFRYLKVKHVDSFPSRFSNQFLLCHRCPEEKEPVFSSFLSSLYIGLPIISVDHIITLSTCELLDGDKPDPKLTRMMEELTDVNDRDVLVDRICFPADCDGVNEELRSDESENIPHVLDRRSNKINSSEIKNDHPVTNHFSGQSLGLYGEAVTNTANDVSSSLYNEFKSESRITEHQNSSVQNSFDYKDASFSDENDSFGFGTLFSESHRCRDDDLGKQSQLSQGSNKVGDIGYRRELSSNESLGFENLFDENFHCKDAMRPTAPKIKQTSKQRKRARRKRKREAGGIDDDDDDDEAVGGSKSLNNADTPSLKKKPKKVVPNYFVAIRVSNPDIHAGVKIVQDSLVTHDKRLKAALIPLETLHLTLLVIHLQDDEQILKAAGTLNQCQVSLEPILQNGALTLTFSGLDHFGHQVLFVKLGGEEELAQLNSVANIIRETFEKEGIPSADSQDFKPHLTVMKLSRSPKLRKKGMKKIPVESYTSWVDYKFGEDSVNALYLCSMNDTKDEDGFYKSVASLHFPSDIGVEDPPQVVDDPLKNEIDETVTELETRASSFSYDAVCNPAEDCSRSRDLCKSEEPSEDFATNSDDCDTKLL